MKNDVWDIMLRPEGKLMVTSKRIYKIKHAANGSIDTHKARFLARAFSQKEVEDYDEIYYFPYFFIGMEFTSNGCKDCFPQWCNLGKGVYRANSRF